MLGNGQVLTETRSGVTSYYLYDGQGSVRGLTNSAGAVTDSYSYDAFGNLLTSQGSTVNPYRYDGQYFDSLTGLYDLRARYYDPTTGRFTSADTADVTLENPTELNRYLYVASDPINAIDPTGQDALEEDSAEYSIEENAHPSVEQLGRADSTVAAADEAASLAVTARALTKVALRRYMALYPELPEPRLGELGVGLSVYLNREDIPRPIAALNVVGRILGKKERLEDKPKLREALLYYNELTKLVQEPGFTLLYREFGYVSGKISYRQAARLHEEAQLVSYLEGLNLAGQIMPKSFPIIGVSQDTICGTCLEYTFKQPGDEKAGATAREAEVALLPPESQVTVVTVGIYYANPPD